jgi:hypothetical protein
MMGDELGFRLGRAALIARSGQPFLLNTVFKIGNLPIRLVANETFLRIVRVRAVPAVPTENVPTFGTGSRAVGHDLLFSYVWFASASSAPQHTVGRNSR